MRLLGRIAAQKFKIVALVIVAAIVVFVLWRPGDSGAKADAGEPETAIARRGQLPIVIETTGQIQAENSVSINPPEQHNLQITWLIEEGKEVKKGELLLKFDDKYQKERLQRSEMNLENQRQRLAGAEEQIKIEEAEIEKQLAAVDLQVSLAKMEMGKYGEVIFDENGMLDDEGYTSAGAPAKGEAYQQFRQAELNITKAETDLERAVDNFNGMDALLLKGFVTLSEFDKAELAVTEAERRLESVHLTHAILARYTHPMSFAAKRHALERAENEVETTQIGSRSRLVKAETALCTAKMIFDRYDREVKELKEALEGLEIKAPIDGIVLFGDPAQSWMRNQITVGAHVWHGMRLFTFPDLSSLIIESRVLEMDFYKVVKDQEITATVEALPDLELTGKISSISESARANNWWGGSADWTYFAFKATMDQADERLKPGMSCEVEIVTDTIDDAIYVPVGAVFTTGERRLCYVVEGDSTTPVEVKVGKSSEEFVQILEGLDAGETVLLSAPKVAVE